MSRKPLFTCLACCILGVLFNTSAAQVNNNDPAQVPNVRKAKTSKTWQLSFTGSEALDAVLQVKAKKNRPLEKVDLSIFNTEGKFNSYTLPVQGDGTISTESVPKDILAKATKMEVTSNLPIKLSVKPTSKETFLYQPTNTFAVTISGIAPQASSAPQITSVTAVLVPSPSPYANNPIADTTSSLITFNGTGLGSSGIFSFSSNSFTAKLISWNETKIVVSVTSYTSSVASVAGFGFRTPSNQTIGIVNLALIPSIVGRIYGTNAFYVGLQRLQMGKSVSTFLSSNVSINTANLPFSLPYKGDILVGNSYESFVESIQAASPVTTSEGKEVVYTLVLKEYNTQTPNGTSYFVNKVVVLTYKNGYSVFLNNTAKYPGTHPYIRNHIDAPITRAWR